MAVTPSVPGGFTGLGTSPPAPTVRGGDSSRAMIIGIGTGTSPAVGPANCLRIYAPGWSGDDTVPQVNGSGVAPTWPGPVPTLEALGSATNALAGKFYVSSVDSAGNINIAYSGTLPASQAANTYVLALTLTGPLD